MKAMGKPQKLEVGGWHASKYSVGMHMNKFGEIHVNSKLFNQMYYCQHNTDAASIELACAFTTPNLFKKFNGTITYA